MCLCVQVVVNGVGGASGDQDTENTELMAIYTKENQGAEKVKKLEKKRRSVTQSSMYFTCLASHPKF